MQITQYNWSETSPIRQIDIHKLGSGGLEAFIHAPKDAGAGQLGAIPALLKQKGFEVVADHVEGEDVQRVSGLKDEKTFFQELNTGGVVSGAPTGQQVTQKDQTSFVDKVRGKTVKLSGLSGLVGHAAMAVSGILEKDYKRVATSAFYSTSTSMYAFKGLGDGGGEFRKLVGDMRAYLDEQGVPIPQGTDLTADELSKKGGVVETLTRFMNEHPLEVGTSIGVMGNIFMMRSGLSEGGQGFGRTASGLCSLIAGLAIALVPEKAKSAAQGGTGGGWPGVESVAEPGQETQAPAVGEGQEKGGILSAPKKAVEWIQEKPMRFAGLMFLGGNLSLAHNAMQTKKKYDGKLSDYENQLAALEDRIKNEGADAALKDERAGLLSEYGREKMASKSTGFAYTTAAAYMLATAFTSISSKTKKSDYTDQETLSKLCAFSANMIAAQPQEMREEAIGKMAEFLETQPDAIAKKDEIVRQINEKVDQLSASPWVAKMASQEVREQGAPAAGR